MSRYPPPPKGPEGMARWIRNHPKNKTGEAHNGLRAIIQHPAVSRIERDKTRYRGRYHVHLRPGFLWKDCRLISVWTLRELKTAIKRIYKDPTPGVRPTSGAGEEPVVSGPFPAPESATPPAPDPGISPFQVRFARWLRRTRARKDLTLQEVSDLLAAKGYPSMSRQMLLQIEQGAVTNTRVVGALLVVLGADRGFLTRDPRPDLLDPVDTLRRYATGQIEHLHAVGCPTAEAPERRDPTCPVCRALITLE